jgi:hypothetical protein
MEDEIAKVKANCGAEAQKQAMDIFALKARTDLVNLTPHRTGQTQQHWEIRREDDQSRTVFNQYPVMGYLENGTKEHDIYPVRKKALFWDGASHPWGKVHNPGMAARNITQKYCDTDGRWRFVEMIQQMIARVAS